MPAIKNITKDRILEAGYDILKRDGEKKVNARSLAKELSCSTQPIYDSFLDMEEFMDELLLYVRRRYYSYIEKEKGQDRNLYLEYTKAYLKYCFEFPNLYDFIFVSHPYKDNKEDRTFNENIISQISKKGNLSKEAATSFFLQTWVFATGIAFQMRSNYTAVSLEDAYHLLEENFEALRNYYHGK